MIPPRNLQARKRLSRRSGFLLIEAMICLSILTVLGIVLLKISMNILAPRQWIMQQTITDAYMSGERARAERIPFASFRVTWPQFNVGASIASQIVNGIGSLPDRVAGGIPINGVVTRTSFPDPNNLPVNSGTGTNATNPASMNIWRLQSVLTYNIGGVAYVKSRTVLRSQ